MKREKKKKRVIKAMLEKYVEFMFELSSRSIEAKSFFTEGLTPAL